MSTEHEHGSYKLIWGIPIFAWVFGAIVPITGVIVGICRAIYGSLNPIHIVWVSICGYIFFIILARFIFWIAEKANKGEANDHTK